MPFSYECYIYVHKYMVCLIYKHNKMLIKYYEPISVCCDFVGFVCILISVFWIKRSKKLEMFDYHFR